MVGDRALWVDNSNAECGTGLWAKWSTDPRVTAGRLFVM